MDKKKIIIISASILALILVPILYYRYTKYSNITIGQMENVTPIDEKEIPKEELEKYECSKTGTFIDIVLGDLIFEDDEEDIEGEPPQNIDEISDNEEIDDEEIEDESQNKIWQKDTTKSDIGKIKIDDKFTIYYYDTYEKIEGEKKYTFNTKEGYSKYRIDKYGDNDKITVDENNLTKIHQYSIDEIEIRTKETKESHIKSTLDSFEHDNYSCKKVN